MTSRFCFDKRMWPSSRVVVLASACLCSVSRTRVKKNVGFAVVTIHKVATRALTPGRSCNTICLSKSRRRIT